MLNMWHRLHIRSTYIQPTIETHFYTFSIIKQSLVIFLRWVHRIQFFQCYICDAKTKHTLTHTQRQNVHIINYENYIITCGVSESLAQQRLDESRESRNKVM